MSEAGPLSRGALLFRIGTDGQADGSDAPVCIVVAGFLAAEAPAAFWINWSSRAWNLLRPHARFTPSFDRGKGAVAGADVGGEHCDFLLPQELGHDRIN